MLGHYLLLPFAKSAIAVYLIGAVAATIFEFLVGIVMQRLLGEVWWDYNEKPFNYKGIICLESTIAWGAYALIVVYFFHNRVGGKSIILKRLLGKFLFRVVFLLYKIDFIYHLLEALGVNMAKYRESVVERYRRFRERF